MSLSQNGPNVVITSYNESEKSNSSSSLAISESNPNESNCQIGKTYSDCDSIERIISAATQNTSNITIDSKPGTEILLGNHVEIYIHPKKVIHDRTTRIPRIKEINDKTNEESQNYYSEAIMNTNIELTEINREENCDKIYQSTTENHESKAKFKRKKLYFCGLTTILIVGLLCLCTLFTVLTIQKTGELIFP